jgi:hypothetical protein
MKHQKVLQAEKKRAALIEILEPRIAPASIIVTNLHAAGPGSLVQAITDANAAAGADDIHFAPGLHGTIKLLTDLPQITDSLTITGPGAGRLTISGHQQHQLLNIDGADLSVAISGLRLAGGMSQNGGGATVNDAGGTVLLSKITISGNHAVGDTASATSGNGGGLEILAGTVTLQSSHVSNNHAGIFKSVVNPYTSKSSIAFRNTGEGGGIDLAPGANLDVVASIIHANFAANGGGIHNAGQLLIESHSTISTNLARIVSAGGDATVKGGGILNDAGGMVTISGSIIRGNRAIGAPGIPGGLDSSHPPTAGGDAIGGGIFNAAGGTLSLVASKVTGNKAMGGLGGFGHLGDTGIAGIGGGQPGRRGGTGGAGAAGGDATGGGIANDGTLTLQSAVVRGNVSRGGSGGTGGEGGTGGQGGGGEVSYDGGFISTGETSGLGGPAGYGGPGGKGGTGAAGGVFDSTGTVVLTSSIVSGNTVYKGARGTAGEYGDRGPSDDGYTANNY